MAFCLSQDVLKGLSGAKPWPRSLQFKSGSSPCFGGLMGRCLCSRKDHVQGLLQRVLVFLRAEAETAAADRSYSHAYLLLLGLEFLHSSSFDAIAGSDSRYKSN